MGSGTLAPAVRATAASNRVECFTCIDHVGGHASAAQVGGEEQAGWAGSDYEHYGLMAWAVHRRKGFQKI
jgi:hypothetical protein